MNKVLTLVLNVQEASLDKILAAAINEAQAAGHTVVQVRVADDSGETIVAPNTVAGVNPPPDEPSTAEPEPDAPAPSEETTPEEEPPADEPVDPTEVTASTPA